MPANRPLLVGDSNFSSILKYNGFFIDKSLFIKDFIEDSFQVDVILRPRRFGKSINLSMLHSFLSYGAKLSSFRRFKISKYPEFARNNCGKYPVLYLNLKEALGETWDEMYSNIWLKIRVMVRKHFKKSDEEFSSEYSFAGRTPPSNFIDVLSWLTEVLYEKHQEQVIILIDEYDAPLNHAARKGFYDVASGFFLLFYSFALKDNPFLRKACLMGIVEIRGSGIFSGLNNLKVYSVAHKKFSKYFGFTVDEIKPYAGRKLKKVLNWYNGYNIGGHSLINPWSFMSWYDSKKFENYWVGSANVESVSTILGPHFTTVLSEVIELSHILGHKQLIDALKTAVNYGSLKSSPSSIWHLLVNSGYLTYETISSDRNHGYAFIPNNEIRKHWQDAMKVLMPVNTDLSAGLSLHCPISI